MVRTILDAINSEYMPPAPPVAAPTAMVFHSYAEFQAATPYVLETHRPIFTSIVTGTVCKVRKGHTEVVAAWAPPLNALCLPRYPDSIFRNTLDYIPDHTFQRREPQPGDGTGPGAVNQAYAMCKGCFARGWHREETDVSALAFGLGTIHPAGVPSTTRRVLPAERWLPSEVGRETRHRGQ